MYLIEHDAKVLALNFGLVSPPGVLFGDVLPSGPWVVKGQFAAGGRGKAGAIRRATDPDEVANHARDILGLTVRGQPARGIRVEQEVGDAQEAYIALMLEPATASVRVMMAQHGGVDIETSNEVRSKNARVDAIEDAIRSCGDGLPAALTDVGLRMAQMFRACDAMLLEINPLFLLPNGDWLAGDMKLITDENALFRQPSIRAVVENGPDNYPDVRRKLMHGFDYVVVDPMGDIGLLTTGAGLSMMLIDELRTRGLRAYNFLDIRTGGLRGDPSRLVQTLRWIAEGSQVRVLFVNIFAGMSDLDEFARLLLKAKAAVPELAVPMVVRLAGTGFEAAQRSLHDAGIVVTSELEEAIARL